MAPPRAEKRPATAVVHGVRLVDDYAWLKAPNWKEALKDSATLPADIRAHLERENAYTESTLIAGLGSLPAELVAEMRGRMVEDDTSVPDSDGPYAYLSRYREGGQHALLCRTPRDGGEEEVLLDGDREAEPHPYFDVGDAEHSPDHRRLAWSADVTGAELYTVRTRDLATGQDDSDSVTGTSGSLVWSRDSAGYYYGELDDNHRPVRVRYHRLGDPQDRDRLVYEEPEPGWFVHLGETSSRRFLLIKVSDHETSETRLLDLQGPPGEPKLVSPRSPKILYDVQHHGDDLVIKTNAEAEDFKIVTVAVADPSRENWRDLVPSRPGIMVLSVLVLARHLVRLERENANPRLVVREIATGAEHAVQFEEEAYSLGLQPGLEYDTDTVRFVYSSLTTPAETYDYNLVTRERTLRKRQEVPSGYDKSRYVTRRIFGEAPDGERVPISLVHRADLALDGQAPCLLYGYGAYGIAMPASFRTNPLSLLDRGFVYAIAHVRGGTEKGWRWYLDGKRENKPNTFKDFIACAESLIAAGYTGRGRIVAQGGSAGGMLMGAVANLAGDLFAGIAAEVPFVDVLNTMLDEELPLTPPEWPEWGNPVTDRAAFDAILAYSPYENVAARRYPPILALGGLTDPRVTYWEPAKWAARLRATMTGGGPIFLRINMEAGHGGAAGRFERLEEVALVYGFALQAAGGAWPSS